LLSAFFMVFVSLIFTFTLRNFVDPQYTKIPVFNIMKTFWMNKNISRIYIVNLILKFFYAWMIIYTPIYLNQHIGLGWDQIGIIFAIMITPFVILDFPLGKLSDKIGEKKLLIGGLAIMSISTLIIPFIGEPKVWLWALVLFATRVGAATVDTMTESYFFKNIEEENVNVLSFYRNTTPLSYVISPLVAIAVLYFVPSFEYLFVVLGAVLTTGLFISLRLKDVR
jgi:MFS family permease